VDGTQITGYTNVAFAGTTESHVWETISWNPTWGGAGDVVTADMWQRIDHVYVSGAN
jgi:hypothetical protein